MRLSVIGSSSKGNGYVIQDKDEALVIEAGVSISSLKEAVSFNIKKIVGCIVTHEHGDHSKHTGMYIKNGVDVYMSKGTRSKLKLKEYLEPKILIPHTTDKLGNFTILPFDVKHDAEEPLGFLIHHKKIGNVLFLTDSYYTQYKFPNLNHIIVEANFCQEIVKEKFVNRDIHPVVYRRLFKSHMSIQSTKELLKANDLSAVSNIVLIHLSESNSDAKSFKQQVEGLTGIPTKIAEANLEIDLVI